MKRRLLLHAFSASIYIILLIFFFSPLIGYATVADVLTLKQPCLPEINPLSHVAVLFFIITGFRSLKLCSRLLPLGPCYGSERHWPAGFASAFSTSGFATRVILVSWNETGLILSGRYCVK